MVDAQTVGRLVRSFDVPGDGQAMKSVELILDLLERSPAPFSREQFGPGHITCTGLVLAPDGERLLLVHHRRLDRWLLPGGHVEPDDATIADAARREVIEETGAALGPESFFAGADVHGIPGKKHEPYHLHHDLLFHFRALADELRVSEESHAVVWCSPAEFDRYDVPGNVRRAYRRVVS
ncbi:MAG TPA: NUDIX domain-containing protein [Verrucomicrobiae bacterium]|nr:NUDIX domain-containing protein [Verrucomicrobiae bacterium]